MTVWVWLSTSALVLLIPFAASLDFLATVEQSATNVGSLMGAPGTVFLAPLVVQVGGGLLVTLVVAAGQLVWHQSRTRRQLAEAREHGLVLDERSRIARELHDVVAHHVSMVSVRAETAPYRLGELAEPVAREFVEIAQASRESLAEMRRLLGVLRHDGPPLLSPQPGLADLAELVDATRAAGTPVTLEMHGSMGGLPSAVDVSTYRILQEALTNAARHATGSAVHVTLRRSRDNLRVSVRNGPGEGGAQDAGPSSNGGHGIRGMRERVAMLDGELHAGPTEDGGFAVTVTLPLHGGER